MRLILVSVVYIIVLSETNTAFAQNLVPNGSFEEYSSCPENAGDINKANYWKLILNSPDFFSDCTINNQIYVPNNFAGNQLPFEGHSYAGFITIEPPNIYYREILGARLSAALVPGNSYHVSMRVSRGHNPSESIITASNNIGIRFTTFSYSLSNYTIINNFAQLNEDSVITNNNEWILLHWNYIPDSAYTYLYIGNFFDNQHTSTINFGSSSPSTAYYYLDSINIFCIGNNCFSAIQTISEDSIFISPNPSSNILTVTVNNGDKFIFQLFDVMGRRIRNGITSRSVTIETSELRNGFYILELQLRNQIVQKQLIIHH